MKIEVFAGRTHTQGNAENGLANRRHHRGRRTVLILSVTTFSGAATLTTRGCASSIAS
jgi:hypothetical protein